MSGRQSLYGQSLVRNANALSIYMENNQQNHWKRDYYTPSKEVLPLASNVVTPTPTPTPFGQEDTPGAPSQQKYNFKVKTWVIDTDYKPVVDGEEDDVLDLDLYSGVETKRVSDLTDDAIRGAVGSEGSISGLSKANDVQAPEEKKEEEKNDPEAAEAIVVDKPEETATELQKAEIVTEDKSDTTQEEKLEQKPEEIVVDKPEEITKEQPQDEIRAEEPVSITTEGEQQPQSEESTKEEESKSDEQLQPTTEEIIEQPPTEEQATEDKPAEQQQQQQPESTAEEQPSQPAPVTEQPQKPTDATAAESQPTATETSTTEDPNKDADGDVVIN